MARSDRRRGGISDFVIEKYVVSCVDVDLTHAECLCLKICFFQTTHTLLSIYRPPANSVSRFILELETVSKRFTHDEVFCLTGDLNIDIL